MSKIEWTERTWNPIAGCSLESPGCTNCYAMSLAARLARMKATAPIYAGLTQPSKAGPVWTGRIAVNEKALLEPLRRAKPTMYFVNSMSDLFHESVPDELIDRVFAVMALCPQHTFQVLTKRSPRMRDYLSNLLAMDPDDRLGRFDQIACDLTQSPCAIGPFEDLEEEAGWPLRNVWLGVSVEDQKRADERIPDLLNTPAAIRFLSCEPLLGPVDLTRTCIVPRVPGSPRAGIHIDALGGRYVESGMPYIGQWDISRPYPADAPALSLDWVIAGGENGPRPMHPDWARSLRDQCAAAGVPFFFKQWGSWAPVCEMTEEQIDACYHPAPISRPDASRRLCRKQCVLHADGQRFDGEAMYRRPAFEQGSRAMTMFSIGKKASGRLLDGVTHDAMPEVSA